MSNAIIGFAMAVVVFAAALTMWIDVSEKPARALNDGAVLDSRAVHGLAQILGDTGLSSGSGGEAWHQDPDNITRFGIASSDTAGRLDLAKLRNLTRGVMRTDASNGLLDYEEARDALGLGDFDFHLRMYPLLITLAEGAELVKANVSYIGDFDQDPSGAANYPVQNTTTLTDLGSAVRLTLNITNNGTEATVFQAEFTVALDDGNLIDTANTRLLDPGESQQVALRLYKTTAWDWNSDQEVVVRISDTTKTVGEFPVDLSAYDMTAGASSGHASVTADIDKLVYKTASKPTVHFDVWDGEGKTVKNIEVNITVRDPVTDAILRSWQGDTKQNNNKVMFDALSAGHYRVNIHKTSDSSYNSTDWFHVTDDTVGEFESSGSTDWTETAASAYERGIVGTLVDDWANTTYDLGGDVYPDLKNVMNNDLANNLSADKYDILVVGSGVSHNAMTSASAKHAVRDFVLEGGLLVVFGSDEQQVNWLQPLFHSSLTTSGDSVGVPDSTHPVLHSPEELAYDTYDDQAKAWKFNRDEDASHFSHIIPRDAGGGKTEDVLAVSKPGHYGNGTILLTSWELWDLTDPQNDEEARKMMHNFISFLLGALYVDLGPRIPDHAEVASSTRVATSENPTRENSELLVRAVLYVFR